jgi:hypothetical protein
MFERIPMRRGALVFQQPGCAQNQRTGTDRGDIFRLCRLLAQKGERGLVLHQILLTGPAGHHDDIERRTIGIGRGRHDLHAPVGGHRLEAARHQMHLGVGQPRQHLIRPGHVELGQSREDEHSDVAGHD